MTKTRSNTVRGPTVGQFSLDGHVYGLEKIVSPPEVIEDRGLRVIHLAISETDNEISGFTAEALRQARTLVPETKSRGKPIWFTQEWQAKRRMKKYGVKK